jgi:hypothetical protein
MRIILFLAAIFMILGAFTNCVEKQGGVSNITKIEFHLSAFGVESDDFPSINGTIDFKKDSSFFERSYYNPKYKNSGYSLTKKEILKVKSLLQNVFLDSLKGNANHSRSDQPSSTITIFEKGKVFVVKDYALEGTDPLKEIYGIVYKLNL